MRWYSQAETPGGGFALTRKTVPAVAILVATSSFVVTCTGCSVLGYISGTILDNMNAEESTFTPAGIDSIEEGVEVSVVFASGSTTSGKLERVPRVVYMILPSDTPDVGDSLVQLNPIAGERVVVYDYPSLCVYFEGDTDLDSWPRALNPEGSPVRYLVKKSTAGGPSCIRLNNPFDADRNYFEPVVINQDTISEIRQKKVPTTARWAFGSVGLLADLALAAWQIGESFGRSLLSN